MKGICDAFSVHKKRNKMSLVYLEYKFVCRRCKETQKVLRMYLEH